MSFFGQKTAVILDSGDWVDPFMFLRFLKKKQDGQWEKPSQKEGKALKINLLEIVAILDVFANRSVKWQTVHKFQEESTSISIERQGDSIILMITGYAKPLKGPEVKIFWDLLAHIYEEKIIYATVQKNGGESATQIYSAAEETIQATPKARNIQNATKKADISPQTSDKEEPFETDFENPFEETMPTSAPSPKYNPEEWLKALKTQDDFRLVPGDVISKSPKAISFQIMNLKQIWVPSSCINPIISNEGGLWIKNWFLEKKLAEIFG